MKKFYYLLFMLLLSWSSVNLCQAQTLIRQDGNIYIEDDNGEMWQVDTTTLIVRVDTLATPSNIDWKVDELGFVNYHVPSTVLIENIKDSLSRLPNVLNVSYTTYAKPATTYNDSLYSEQWYLTNYRFDSLATAVPASHKDIIIALIEGGVDFNHPDLGVSLYGNPPQYGALYVNTNEIPNNNVDDDSDGYVDNYLGWNFYTNSGIIDQIPAHGTQVFGLIGAKTNNHIGTAGLIGTRNDIKIMPLCAGPGIMPGSCIKDAIRYAANHGANIINMSFTVSASDWVDYIREAVDYAKSKGVLMVASAGNDSTNTRYPACDERVVGVGSVNSSNLWSLFSNCGGLDVAAPGEGIYVPTKYGSIYDYASLNGTSFSAPAVSTLAAFIMAQNPFLSADDVRCIIDTTALIDPIYDTFQQSYEWGVTNGDTRLYCQETGFGTIQPKEAIKAAKRKLPYINFYDVDANGFSIDMYFNIGNSPDNICYEPYLEDFPDAEYTCSWNIYPISNSGLRSYSIDDGGDWFVCHLGIDPYWCSCPYFYLIGTIKDLNGSTVCTIGGSYGFGDYLPSWFTPMSLGWETNSGRIILKNGTLQENKNASIVVYSIDKRIVHQQTIDLTQSEIPIDLSSLKNGHYFVKVYVDGENVLNKQVLKMR